MPSVRLVPAEIADAAMGRFVRPVAGLAGLPPDGPIRLLDGDGRIVGVGTLDGRRLAPSKMLPGAVADVAADRAGAPELAMVGEVPVDA
jgi:hypothetical protein